MFPAIFTLVMNVIVELGFNRQCSSLGVFVSVLDWFEDGKFWVCDGNGF